MCVCVCIYIYIYSVCVSGGMQMDKPMYTCTEARRCWESSSITISKHASTGSLPGLQASITSHFTWMLRLQAQKMMCFVPFSFTASTLSSPLRTVTQAIFQLQFRKFQLEHFFSFFFFIFIRYLAHLHFQCYTKSPPYPPTPNPLPTHSPFLALAFPCTGAYKVCVSDGPLFPVMAD
jgi:hypothetical protein